jgi:hypothetical protein
MLLEMKPLWREPVQLDNRKLVALLGGEATRDDRLHSATLAASLEAAVRYSVRRQAKLAASSMLPEPKWRATCG